MIDLQKTCSQKRQIQRPCGHSMDHVFVHLIQSTKTVSIDKKNIWMKSEKVKYDTSVVGTEQSSFPETATAPHSSTLAWKIPWMEEPGRLCGPWGPEESDMTERLHFHFSLSCIGEGNGNPLQCSCLENPRDGRAWWAAVYGVAQSQTRLKQLISSSSHVSIEMFLS